VEVGANGLEWFEGQDVRRCWQEELLPIAGKKPAKKAGAKKPAAKTPAQVGIREIPRSNDSVRAVSREVGFV
jgi:hypothetical protein